MVVSNRNKFKQVSEKEVQEFLDEKYPKNGICKRDSDKENKDKKRKEIIKLDLSRGTIGRSGNKILKGSLKLENFFNLEVLKCSSQQITNLDVSECSKLKKIDCSGNQIVSLNIKGLIVLEEINCYNNKIEKLDFSESTNLKKIYCHQNLLKEIVGLEKLEKLTFINSSPFVITSLTSQKKQNLEQTFAEQLNQQKPVLEKKIGKGGYGEVYYGKWKLQDVAIKKLYLSLPNISQKDRKNIQKEIDILKSLKNKYVIQYYDTYSDEQEVLIIMEYAENGTLTKLINDNEDKEHDWNFNSELIRQMVLGLAYIHQGEIIHRDLKSLNILLTSNFQVKISDFGLSKTKIASSSQSKNDTTGTLRWMAPELLKGEKYSEQSDIYALGMIIWEIVAKCTVPFEDTDNNLVYIHIREGGKETIPDDTPQNISHVIKECWKDNPNERISLVNMLEIIESDKVNPIAENLSQPQQISEQFHSGLQIPTESFSKLNVEESQQTEQQTQIIHNPPKNN